MTKQKLKIANDPLSDLKTPAAKGLMQYILSDLERQAFKCAFQPFVYTINSKKIYLSAPACNSLLFFTRQKLDLLIEVAEQERLCTGIPYKYRDMLYDPRITLSLPARMRNRLFKLECYTLMAIKMRGRDYFLQEQNFSKKYMQTLDSLFERCKARHLFI